MESCTLNLFGLIVGVMISHLGCKVARYRNFGRSAAKRSQ